MCGLIIVVFFLVVNPQQEPGSLYWLKVWCQYLLLPLFIYAPLPYIKKWKGTILSKFSVFFGAVVIVNFYFAFLLYGNYYVDQFWLVDSLFWTAGTFIPAFVIYCGSYRGDLFISQTPEKKTYGIEPEDGTKSGSIETRKNFVIMVCLLLFLIPSILILTLGDTSSCGGFEIAEINQSQVQNSTVRHLNEQDFRNFSRMAPFIRDNKTITARCYSHMLAGNTCVGSGGFRCREGPQFRQYEGDILEYEGRYYIMAQTYIV